MLVKNWMTRDPVTTTQSTPLSDAYRLLCEYEIRHLLVVDGDELVGILSDRDVARRFYLESPNSWMSAVVEDVMTPHPVTVTPEESIANAALIMHNQKISGLPVVSPGGTVQGILTTSDLLEIIASEPDTAAAGG